MKKAIQMLIAVLVIVGAAYWAYTTATPLIYSGSNIMFSVGSGHAVVTNPGDEAIPIEMRSGARASAFRIRSSDLGLNMTSKRVGTGRDAFHSLTFDLPPGTARIDVASGSDVRMISRADTRIQASVVPVAANTVRWVLIISGVAVAWALYYLSRVTEHRWLGALRNRLSGGRLQPKQTTTG